MSLGRVKSATIAGLIGAVVVVAVATSFVRSQLQGQANNAMVYCCVTRNTECLPDQMTEAACIGLGGSFTPNLTRALCSRDVCNAPLPPASVCPNGITEGTEECDDDNQITTDACIACVDARCRDGFPQAGVDECDDGNQIDNDGCTNQCKNPFCGDTIIQPANETCEDGNVLNTDACVGCVAARCGDTFVQAGVEQCDDGNLIDTDGCNNNCKLAFCNNNVVEAGEQCDGPGKAQCAYGETCNVCRCGPNVPSVCGNSLLEPGEQCDGTLGVCSAGKSCVTCQCVPPPPVCPNGNLEPEVIGTFSVAPQNDVTPSPQGPYDPNNVILMTYSDVTTPSFTVPKVPMLLLSGPALGPSYADDWLDLIGPAGSANISWWVTVISSLAEAHTYPYPKDVTGLLSAPGTQATVRAKLVDGGSMYANTAMELTLYECDLSACGNGTVDSGEQCEGTGQAQCAAGKTCSSCQCVSLCGNRRLNAGEGCDDGNTTPNDCCSPTCTVEPGCSCTMPTTP